MDGIADGSAQGGNSKDGALFDATQYAFFGGDNVEEVELGGLDDDEEVPVVGFDDDHCEVNGEKDAKLGPLNEIDDIANSFSKLNRVASGPPTVQRDFDGRVITGSSTASEWAKQADYPTRYDQPAHLSSYSLHRTSSYPEPHPLPQQRRIPTPIPVPKSSFPSYPPNGGIPQNQSPNSHFQHPTFPYGSGQPQQIPSSQSISPFSHLSPESPHNSRFGGNLSLPPPGQWQNLRPNSFHIFRQQPPPQNGLRPHLPHQVRLNFSHLPLMRPQMFGPGPHLSASINRFEANLALPDLIDQIPNSLLRNSQNFDYGGWPQYQSKHMTAEEIENIIRMQLAATHSNDPYMDDYYHQACLAKKSRGKHHFCPNFLRKLPSHGRASYEPHAFLQVEGLGMIPFSSVRRPRPLLDMEPAKADEKKTVVKSLNQEPFLEARVAIEDASCLLLDIDDIDRFLQFNKFVENGSELKQRRDELLEELRKCTLKDDLVFLRIVSLPKGKKLVLRLLSRLRPKDELLQVLYMAIFRHFRFFFGGIFSDSTQVGVSGLTLLPLSQRSQDRRLTDTRGLEEEIVSTVSSHVHKTDLDTLSACLKAFVSSSEQPPLTPRDGPSIILNAVLERATTLLRDRQVASSPSRPVWQASFNEFFDLLIKCCFSKYDTILSSNRVASEPEVARAIENEMPVQLLRASLPHINEGQRKVLMEFSQRSV